MAGKKGRSGGKRPGAGAKRGDLVHLHEIIDLHVADGDWAAIIGALVKKARRGNVSAFRELRACRFGQIPLAPVPDPAPGVMVTLPPWARQRDEKTLPPSPPSPPSLPSGREASD